MEKYGYGVDIGGTTVKMGLFKADGELIEKWSIDTDISECGKNIARDVGCSILDNIKRHGISADSIIGAGIGLPGQIHRDGTADATNLGWDRAPLVTVLEPMLGFRVTCNNDANMAALGEYWKGSGKGYSSLVLVTLGTGVGGGIIVDGKCLDGAHGAAGEIGHIPVEPLETVPCGCGSRGCLEQYASATGNVRIAAQMLAADSRPSVLRNVEKLDSKVCWDAAIAGDELANDIAERFCDYLARGLAALANTIDPEVILLGGGVARTGRPLIERVTKYYKRYAFPPCRDTEIRPAVLGNDAGIYGSMYSLL